MSVANAKVLNYLPTHRAGAVAASLGVNASGFVPVDPLTTERIEVLRGPATLLYGGTALGGAVNVIDNRIPESTADSLGHGTLELRAGGAGKRYRQQQRNSVADTGLHSILMPEV